MAIQKCSLCNSTFAKVEHLKRHERSHTGEKPYQCKHCQKRFARRDVLNRHVKGHGVKSSLRFITTGSLAPQLTSGCTLSPVLGGSLGPYTATGDLEQSSTPISASKEAASATVAPASVAAVPVPVTAETTPPQSSMTEKPSTIQPVTRMRPRGIAAQAQLFPSAFPSDPRTTQDEDQICNAFMHLSPDSSLFREHAPCADASMEAFASPPETLSSGQGFQSIDSDGRLSSTSLLYPDLSLSSADQANNTYLSVSGDSPAWLAMFSLEVPPSMNAISSESNLQPHSPPTRDFQTFVSRATDQGLSPDISDERFSKMSSVWPKKGERPWHLMQTLWSDVMSYPGSNLFSEPGATDCYHSPTATATYSVKSRWGLEHEKYVRLVKEFAKDETGINTRFPSEDTLGVCIDLYFQRFHSIMGFIHQPTFSANDVPNIVLFSICLIGLTMVDPESNRSFVSAHLSLLMDRCEAELSRTWRREESIRLCAVFATSVLLMCCVAIIPDQMCSKQTYEFYTNILFMATQHGLFEMRKYEQLQTVPPPGQPDDLSWKAWARFESANRLITCLVMADALFASSAGTSPIIRTETMRLYTPCSNALFAAHDVKRWLEIIRNGPEMNVPILDLGEYPSDLPRVISSNGLAIHTVLAAIMLRIADIRHRGAEREQTMSKDEVLFPCIQCLDSTPGLRVKSLMFDIYTTYQQELKKNSPNGLAFWHYICISMTANIELFELAAGREGPQPARQAIRRISTWAQSPIARRACLHAAQVYTCMSQRKIADGTMFMSERAIFHSALVLGMYLYVSPPELQVSQTMSVARTCLELLDDVDWTRIGDQGLCGDTIPKANCSGVAEKFITEGGAISFAGTAYHGGYCSARRVILDYVGLLEEVGRWNGRELCQILRLMGGSMVELD